MNFRPVAFLLFFGLFAVSANKAWACGSDNSGEAAKSHQEASHDSCCDADEAQSPCAGGFEHQHSGSDCPCDHDNGECHCPGCGLVCHSGGAFPLETPFAPVANVLNFSVQKGAFYFAEHLPEAVYLPIWQPPKLGV